MEMELEERRGDITARHFAPRKWKGCAWDHRVV